MRHIKIFEAYSSALPNNAVISTEEIKRMSLDEFRAFIEIYVKEKNTEQLFTLIQIFMMYNPGRLSAESHEIVGAYFDEIQRLLGPKMAELEEITDIRKREKVEAMDRRDVNAEIYRLESNIETYKKYLRETEEELARIKAGGTPKYPDGRGWDFHGRS
jgi:uncharacterized protein YicC (UPF0701 family)